MQIVFVSNFFNHHQRPLSEELYKITGGEYTFIATEEMAEEQKNLGWGEKDIPPYVIEARTEEERARVADLIYDADVVMYGSAPKSMMDRRLKAGKLTFYYSERRYKKKKPLYKLPVMLLRDMKGIIPHKRFYLLSASAYAPHDFALTGAFINKAYKWGYFPEARRYESVDVVIEKKKKNSIVWVARFIDWKHPEMAVKIAKRLKAEGREFELDMIGNGVMLEEIRRMVADNDLEDVVRVPGATSPDGVRAAMEQSEIFLFTSDRNEGWGAVLNEAMNSACAVVANREIGSAPYLIKDSQNGFTYNDIEELYKKTVWLMDHPEERASLGREAYRTITEEWNAANAAKRLRTLCTALLQEDKAHPFDDGICSKAKRRI